MKWPIGGANMVNDFYIPCSLRNNSAIQRLLTIIFCRISNNFSTYFSCTIFTPPCPNLPLSSFAPRPPYNLNGVFFGQPACDEFFICSNLHGNIVDTDEKVDGVHVQICPEVGQIWPIFDMFMLIGGANPGQEV